MIGRGFPRSVVIGAGCMLAVAAKAQESGTIGGWQFGAVFDVAHTSRALEMGARDQGLQLGHSDLSASGPLGRHLSGRLTAVFETHEGKLEKAMEEVWVETRTLPWGLSARAGRFASQIGYLNEQHTHADDFVERPLLYRAFLGGHWNDDGLRINWTLPTSFYWMVGAEAFRGHKLVEEAERSTSGAGAYTLVSRIGGDVDASKSWQLGVSFLHNRRTAVVEEEHDEADHGHDHAHHHHHGAQFGGRRTWMLDATWKWAPDGNNRERQIRLGIEAARVSDINRYASSSDSHQAYAIAAVWRFHPHWEAGARADWLRVAIAHGDHFHDGRLREQAVMLAWKPSHRQSLRLQYTRQGGAEGFEHAADRSVQLQYVLAFGAHGAHSY